MTQSTIISLFHILVTGPVFLFLGHRENRRESVPTSLNLGLLVFLAFAWFFLLSKLYTYYTLTGSVIKAMSMGWIYTLHALIFLPLLFYIVLQKVRSPNVYSSFYSFSLLSIGGLAVFYHMYRLLL